MNQQISHPTFMVIGAQKCGTTWLAKMVSQHPEVSVGKNKEMHFFDKVANYEKGLEWYESQFDISVQTRAVGEFTPNYFWTSNDEKEIAEDGGVHDIPRLVHDAYPDLKLIVCLRNPVDRAVSAYYHHIRNGRIRPSQRITDVAHLYGIESMGYYDVHLKNWLKYYSYNDFMFLIYEEDIKDDNKKTTLGKVFNHIGVDDGFMPEDIFTRYNHRNTHFDMRTRHYPPLIRDIVRRVTPTRIASSKIWQIEVSDEEKRILEDRLSDNISNIEKMIRKSVL